MKNNLFIITGGPGVGKTALLNALSSDGFRVVPEAARAIIREQMETDGDALPWKNKRRYTDKMIAASEIYQTDGEQKQNWEEAQQTYIHMRNTYRRLGYEPIIVPKGSIEERKEFVRSYIAKNGELG